MVKDESDYDDDGVEDFESLDVEQAPQSAGEALRYFGADFDVDGLVRRLDKGDILIPTFDPESESTGEIEGFQRKFVWPKRQMDRFVESLLLGYPVPGIFLVELEDHRYLVLDGQQRLRTLHYFYRGRYPTATGDKVFSLKSVAENFAGKTVDSLDASDKRRLDNSFFQATIVVPNNLADRRAVYNLFERINSSGVKLQPQEIRVALYSGAMITFIRDLNRDSNWRRIFGAPSPRLKDHELILRYLALTEVAEVLYEHDWDRDEVRDLNAQDPSVVSYKPPMSNYLNSYLDRNYKLDNVDSQTITEEFESATEALEAAGGRSVLRLSGSQLNAAHTDAVLSAFTLAGRVGLEPSAPDVRRAIEILVASEEYRAAVSGSTSHADSVSTRLQLAFNALTGRSHESKS